MRHRLRSNPARQTAMAICLPVLLIQTYPDNIIKHGFFQTWDGADASAV